MFSYYLRQRGRKAEKSLNIKQDSGEKLVFVFSQVFCQKKKSSLLLSASKLNLLTIKENCEDKTSGSQSVQRLSFLLLETIPFSVSYFVQLKLFFLMEDILFIGKYLYQRKPLLFREAVVLVLLGEAVFQWKPSLLLEAVPFNGSHSF